MPVLPFKVLQYQSQQNKQVQAISYLVLSIVRCSYGPAKPKILLMGAAMLKHGHGNTAGLKCVAAVLVGYVATETTAFVVAEQEWHPCFSGVV